MLTNDHALQYLNDILEYDEEHHVGGYVAFKIVTSRVSVPCRAIGIAKSALHDCHWDVHAAIDMIKDNCDERL